MGGGGGGGGNGGASIVSLGGSASSGGNAGNVIVSNLGSISATNTGSIGIYAQSIGGGGGDGGSSGGLASIGGSGGTASVGGTVIVDNFGTIISSAKAILAQSVGGGGGNGGSSVGWFSFGGSGAAGNNASNVTVLSKGTLTTLENNATALFAQSLGGGGGNGGNATAVGAFTAVSYGGTGGGGGTGGNVGVGYNLDSLVVTPVIGIITTGGDNANGIQAQSIGGGGGNGGFAASVAVGVGGSASFAFGGNGGPGNSAGNVSVYFGDSNSQIITTGTNANGIFAQSVGGGGGSGGMSLSIAASGGAGPVPAISLALSFGGSAAAGANAGTVTVGSATNPLLGLIQTTGDNSHGIYAQSVGGGGGSGGMSIAGTLSIAPVGAGGAAFSMGGKGGAGGAGSNVVVFSDNQITTAGENAAGIFAQSVGGGGGSGGISVAGGISASAGPAINLNFSFGGAGGAGSQAGNVDVTTDKGLIKTTGYHSAGILAQSVGGGGGDGGFSVTGAITASTGLSGSLGLSMGGDGGAGAFGGVVNVTNGSSILTLGNDSAGILAQSLGGGGGDGGFSVAGSINVGANGGGINIALGGKGGDGSDGSAVTVVSTGAYIITGGDSSTTNASTNGFSADGIIAQSIGGGGGDGGFSVAGGIVLSGGFSGNIGVSLGGKGGTGGIGGNVTVINDSLIKVFGSQARGIVAQSIGGGGGNGGFSVAGGLSIGSTAANLEVSVGGSGGSGGYSGTLNVTNENSIYTYGDNADGIYALSEGGGGGDGGFSVAGGITGSTGKSLPVKVSVGGTGGSGNYGSNVSVMNSGTITTTGSDSRGIFAKSLGGGGGNGGFSVAGDIGFSQFGAAVTVGGSGGSGNVGGAVYATNTGTITTWGANSEGIFAESIGGGGGKGGFSVAGSIALKPGSKSIGVSVGGSGGEGNAGGNVTVTNGSIINTHGDNSDGINARSVGGGGGNGGMSVAGALSMGAPEDQTSVSASVSVGGSGGGGTNNTGGTVKVYNSGNITTAGQTSDAIQAESLGGGGGAGGASLGITLIGDGNSAGKNIALNVSVGGEGGQGNRGGSASVLNSGTLMTGGDSSAGIYAQSVGGGGGKGGASSTFTMFAPGSVANLLANIPIIGSFLTKNGGSTTNNYQVVISVGGNGGTGAEGGSVTVTNSGSITTHGALSSGIYAQSVGGGGGNGGGGMIGTGTKADLLTLVSGASLTKSFSFAMGGNGGTNGHGGSVTVNQSGTITTTGLDSYGILAQSVGGGGGVSQYYLSATNTNSGSGGTATIGLTGTVGLGGAGGAAGNGGDVSVNMSGGISTAANGAIGILAQSVGGGGGVAGNVDRGLPSIINIGLGLAFGRKGGGAGNGGTVTVTNNGSISTLGDNAHGIFAQSVGGGGGLGAGLGIGIQNVLGATSSPSFMEGSVGGAGNGGLVVVNQIGNITTAGNIANGIFAQSAGGTGTGGAVNITVSGNITATNTGSSGIFAQSSGEVENGNISVTVSNGTITGGSAFGASFGTLGAGVQFLDGRTNTLNNNGTITSVGGVNGSAIVTGSQFANELFEQGSTTLTKASNALASMTSTIHNSGTIIGNVILSSATQVGVVSNTTVLGTVLFSTTNTISLTNGPNAFYNNSGGTLDSGTDINLGIGNTLYNAGTIAPGGWSNVLSTTLTGNYVQTNNAIWGIAITPSNTSSFNITGTAQLNGYGNTINLNEMGVPTNAGAYTIISATNGSLSGGTFRLGTLTGDSMPSGLTFGLSNSVTREQLILSTSTGPFYWSGALGNAWNANFVNGVGNWTSDQQGSTTILGTPGAACDVNFTGSAATNLNTTLGTDFTINSLTIGGTQAVSIGGSHTLTISPTNGVGVTINPGAAATTIGANLALGGSQSWINNSSNLFQVNGSTISGNGQNLTVQGAGTTVISASIQTGPGSLTKDDTGTLILNQTSTYSGGTIVNGGSVIVSNTNATGIGNITMKSGVFDNSGTINAPTFNITGGNTFNNGTINSTTAMNITGGRTVNSGTINAHTFNITDGNTFNNGTINTTTAMNISGGRTVNSGTINATNAITLSKGLLINTGLINTGTFTVSGGYALNRGVINATNNVLVASGTVLNGGTITTPLLTVSPGAYFITPLLHTARLEVHGTMQLGAPTDNPMVDTGSLTLGHDALVLVTIDGSKSSQINMTGEVVLGGTLHASGNLILGSKMLFMTAGSISGTFDSVTAPDGFRVRVVDPPETLTLIVAPASYTQLASNRNQSNVATALDSFIPATNGDRMVVSTSLDSLTASQYNQAFNAIMPTMYQSMATIAFNQANALNMQLNQRLWGVCLAEGGGFSMSGFADNTAMIQEGQGDGAGKGVLDSKKDILRPGLDNHWGMFVDANGIFAQANSGNMLPGYNSQSGGVTTGLTYKWNDSFASGLYCGYQGTYSKMGANGSGLGTGSSLIDNAVRFGVFGTYGHKDGKGLYANALAGGAYHNYQATRVIQYTGMNRTANSAPGAGELDTMLATGYDIEKGKFTFGPTASLQYTYLGVNKVNETGAQSLNFNSGGWNSSSMLSSIGAHAAYNWQAGKNVVVVPQISLNWQHEFLQNPYDITGNLGGTSPTFSNTSATGIRDYLYTGVGFTVEFAKKWNTSFFYNAAAGNNDLVSQNIFWSAGVKF